MGAIVFSGATFTTSSSPVDELPKLFSSGTYELFDDVDIGSSYVSHVSASLALTTTSDVKAYWSPSRIREDVAQGRGLAYISCSDGTIENSPEWYFTRGGWSWETHSAGFQWIFSDVPSGTQTFTLMVKSINGEVKMNRVAGVDGVNEGRDVLYIETINR